MAWHTFVVLLAVFGLLPVSAPAQEPLTLPAAVQAALAGNPSLRAGRAGVDEADAQTAESKSVFFPRVSFAESWQRGDQPVFVFSSLLSARRFAPANFAIDALNHPDPIGFFRASATVDQLIFDGGRGRAAAGAALLRGDIARASNDQASAAVALAVTETFGRVVVAQAGRRAVEAAITAASEDLVRGERRRAVGMATDADVLALTLRLANLRERSIQLEADGSIARAELNGLMGEPAEREFQVVEPAPGVDDVPPGVNVAVLLAEADAGRPEIRRANASVRAAEEATRQAHAALIPQAAAQAAFDFSGTRFSDRTSAWIVGGELRWMFSSGGAERAAGRAAAASLARARAEADAARASVHVDVVRGLRRLDAARARRTVGRAAVAQAAESQRIIRDRFDAGIAPVNDVLAASSAVVDAETTATSALVDEIVAEAALRRALGRTP